MPVSIPSHPSAIVDHEFIMDHILIPMKEEEEESEQMISPSGIHSVIEGYVSMSIEYKETYMCLETNSLLLNSLNHLIFINYPKSKCLYAMQSFMHKTYYCCRSSFSQVSIDRVSASLQQSLDNLRSWASACRQLIINIRKCAVLSM